MNRIIPPSAPQLDWDLVRAFLAVVDTGSLTEGAAMLGSSQPTLSRQIRRLEARTGTTLFERVARGLRLTQSGAALVEPARQMQAAAQTLALTALGHTQQLAGTVRLTASEMTSAYLLPPIIARLRRSHPEIQIELVVSNRVENLLERQADIAVRHTRPTQKELIARHIGNLRMGAFAHADYVAQVGKVDISHPDAYDWIGFDSSDLLLRRFREAGIPMERAFFPFRCDNHVACWHAALAGVGISFSPYITARRWPEMQAVLPERMVPPMPVWLTAHRELRSSPRIRLVFDALADALQQLLSTE